MRWGGVGFTENSDNIIAMANSTIITAYYQTPSNTPVTSDMYTSSNANSNPTSYSTKYFTSANFTRLTNGGSRLYLIRSLARPANAPTGYFAFSSTRNQNLIMAFGLQQPASFSVLRPHDTTGKLNLNFYRSVWNCPIPITEQEVSTGGGGGGGTTPRNSTSTGGGTTPNPVLNGVPAHVTSHILLLLLLLLSSILLLW